MLRHPSPIALFLGGLLVVGGLSGCSTADGGSGTRGPRFEEAALISGCPGEPASAGDAVPLQITDETGIAIGAPLSRPGLVAVSAPGAVGPGAGLGAILVSSPDPANVTVVVTLAGDATGTTPTPPPTYVDRCVIRFDPAPDPPECTIDDDCLPGFLCDADTASCVEAPPPPGCTTDEDCGALERCQFETGACLEIECLGDVDCGVDESCDDLGFCTLVPRVQCAFSECDGADLGVVGEIAGMIDCAVTEGTPPASLDLEIECATTGIRLPVAVGCDLFGGPICSAAFSLEVSTTGGWVCETVGVTANPGPAILESAAQCALSVD